MSRFETAISYAGGKAVLVDGASSAGMDPKTFRVPVNILVDPSSSAVDLKTQSTQSELWSHCVQEAKTAGLHTVADMQIGKALIFEHF